MKAVASSSRPSSRESLRGIAYENTKAAKAPVQITTATPPRGSPPKPLSAFRGPKGSQQLSSPRLRSRLQDDSRRDSGLAPSSSTTRNSGTTLATEVDSAHSIRHSPSSPSFAAPESLSRATSPRPKDSTNPNAPTPDERSELSLVPQIPSMTFLTNDIPTGSLEDLTLPGQVQFSKRGSMLIGGKKANASPLSNGRLIGSRRQLDKSQLSPSMLHVPSRILSADDEVLSQRVRAMYERGVSGESASFVDAQKIIRNGKIEEEASGPAHHPSSMLHANRYTASHHLAPSQTASTTSNRINQLLSDGNELAGGIEDWEDVHGGDVDRYGFIVPHRLSSRQSSLHTGRANSPDPPKLQRVSTLLQLASEAPRRHRSHTRKSRLAKSPARSAQTPTSSRPPSEVTRPISSQSSYRSIKGGYRFWTAANRLPYNKDRKCVNEAGDMLTLPPGLADIAEDEEDSKAADDLKRREWERNEKWRRMAKEVSANSHGGGMVFEFDTKSPKLIERTWKGIPDRWRAAAWHSFLTASAKKQKYHTSDDDLIAIFKQLLHQGSPDDVQIDIDVPRTINSHIMFRRRYRGGQRLLFRVLHCMSIYFPDTGYVQGMAALAATFLCYFDEEMTFVMLVRLWQLRGLERLYQSGFEGLMQALDEFEKIWLGKGEIATKLADLNIPPTSYGTRWYLTLFNYSIPFPAQLRVWDVFLLLGEPDVPYLSPPSTSINGKSPSFNGGLDVLHACSAALIAGTREILLDSDFENAMKVLTSWIPVKDEEMLMRVARVEWKTKRRRVR